MLVEYLELGQEQVVAEPFFGTGGTAKAYLRHMMEMETEITP
jgi:hypothetical protein